MSPDLFAGALILFIGLVLGFLFAVLISASRNGDEDG